jgi:predicted enzyme related to lactoylglutathione lyase
MKPKAVDFVALAVSDMDRSEAFYRDVLGLDLETPRGAPGTRGNGFMEFAAGGTAISLTALPERHANGIIALAVEDCRAATEELRARDVPVLMEPLDTGDCTMAVVADPDGNQLMLHQRADGTAG